MLGMSTTTGHGHGHTHDGINWAERLGHLQAIDALDRDTHADVAQRLAAGLPEGATVVDIGSGAGGMSSAFGRALAAAGGGTVVLVDAVPALLDAATAHVRAEAPAVEVVSVLADAADPALPELVPAGDLVWASGVVHHLPDQQRGVNTLARMVRPGGRLALREGGLATQCLPWDVGIGTPGLQGRLLAARESWFERMRADMPDVVRLPGGWGRALAAAGLGDVTSLGFLVDHPAPASAPARESVVNWLTFMADMAGEWLSEEDRATVARLIDPHDSAFVGNSDDVFVLSASTVHHGTRPVPPA
ncbi:methyltransferase family protein [Labedaea rhizosphaerae]|uniref:Methyltransferase family protein n=2 Tax=Labedaea rhizosphaerae TaxID=598644 RepID=A0A4R6RQE4_LABRH|nr:methyltransferase family protein [Labedaea rhizosphaerae]